MTTRIQGSDANRDPITGAPCSHPIGVSVGGIAGGAVSGALAGTVFGPIGTLIGTAAGVVAGAAAGKGIAERIDPSGELDYWRDEYKTRPYADSSRDFDKDYAAAYGYGLQGREKFAGRTWDDLESELQRDWSEAKGASSLAWDEVRDAVRDSWDRADRTYAVYENSDRHFASRFEDVSYRASDDSFEDYRPAYRYGTQARTRYTDRPWDDDLEGELKGSWEKARGTSKLPWDRAKAAVKDAFSSDY